MDVMLRELAFFNQIEFFHCFVKLLMAAVCGCIIGIEREVHRKSAGIRTNMMICLGAALYVIAAEMIMGLHAGGDATRMAGQVVVGMGFIGAGAIIQSRGHIVGLTTAATLWVVAAIGVVIGLGFPLFGLSVTLFVVGILVGVGRLEHMILGKCRFITVRVSFRDDTHTLGEIEELLATFGKNLSQFKITRDGPICFMELTYCTVHPDHGEWFYDLLKIPDVRQTTWHH